MQICTTADQVPTAPHYVILRFRSCQTEGDERSRTNPGHGYPSETINYVEYWQTSDRTRWEERILELTKEKQPFKALHVDAVAIVKPTVNVQIDLKERVI